MDYFSWLGAEEDLSSEALTVRAQNLPANDRDRLVMPIFFPSQSVRSIRLRSITTIDFRPVSDRREWNTRGRKIPTRFPTTEEVEMIPIESTFTIDEYELQLLLEPINGNEQQFRDIIRRDVPSRVDNLTFANRRRFEMDAAQAWSTGTMTVMNPNLGHTQTVSFGFDTSRYQTAGTPWNDVSLNAFDEFVAWVQDGVDVMRGGASGSIMRRATWKEIVKDAPQGLLGVPLTEPETIRRIEDQLGFAFRIVLLENRMDEFNDAGLETTRTNVWPAEKVALIPNGTAVGTGARAPVARAYRMAAESGGAISVNGTAIFREANNGGRQLVVEAQDNWFPLPDEEQMWVIDAGV
jgi:hypothetical protein